MTHHPNPASGEIAEHQADAFAADRQKMVEDQISRRGVRDLRVLRAMRTVPRHLFVPEESRDLAYADQALPIGLGQTISQPYIVAASVEALALEGPPKLERVLEIGTGTGYQTAVLTHLAAEIWSIDRLAPLTAAALERLAPFAHENLHLLTADGSFGWPAAAPFDAILVSAAAPRIPPPLLEQLTETGRLVIPVGSEEHQELLQITMYKGRPLQRFVLPCRFVPLVGHYGWNN